MFSHNLCHMKLRMYILRIIILEDKNKFSTVFSALENTAMPSQSYAFDDNHINFYIGIYCILKSHKIRICNVWIKNKLSEFKILILWSNVITYLKNKPLLSQNIFYKHEDMHIHTRKDFYLYILIQSHVIRYVFLEIISCCFSY